MVILNDLFVQYSKDSFLFHGCCKFASIGVYAH